MIPVLFVLRVVTLETLEIVRRSKQRTSTHTIKRHSGFVLSNFVRCERIHLGRPHGRLSVLAHLLVRFTPDKPN